MRYHSNVFAIKNIVPCVAISYEQKTLGLMKKIGCAEYCIDVNVLCFDKLYRRFKLLESNYFEYKKHLNEIHETIKRESYKTTELLFDTIEKMNAHSKGSLSR